MQFLEIEIEIEIWQTKQMCFKEELVPLLSDSDASAHCRSGPPLQRAARRFFPFHLGPGPAVAVRSQWLPFDLNYGRGRLRLIARLQPFSVRSCLGQRAIVVRPPDWTRSTKAVGEQWGSNGRFGPALQDDIRTPMTWLGKSGEAYARQRVQYLYLYTCTRKYMSLCCRIQRPRATWRDSSGGDDDGATGSQVMIVMAG